MARWRKGPKFSGEGGRIADWVSPEETRALAEEIRGLATLGELADWLYENRPHSTKLVLHGYYARAADGPEKLAEPIAEADSWSFAAMAIEGLAQHRRLESGGSEEPPCTECGEPTDENDLVFYCRDHEVQRDAEVRELLGREKSGQ